MTEYNASDTRQIRRAQRQAKVSDAERQGVILNLMSSPAGRNYMYERLVRSHCFASSFAPNALAMAFAEGERNIGLQDLNDIMRCAPDQYISMMREATDRELANGRRTDSGQQRSSAGANGGDSGPDALNGAVSDYDPGDDASDTAEA